MTTRTLLRQLIVFGLVGATATGVHYVIALVSHEIGHINIYVSNFLGYASALCVSFFGHGTFTFKVASSARTLRRFAIVSASTFSLSEVLLAALQYLNVSSRISLAIIVVAIPGITFLLHKLWVYRHPAELT